MSKAFNKFQKTAIASYAGGEFAGITTMEEIADCGDELFRFLMIELSDREGCATVEDAYHRIDTAMYELRQVQVELRSA